MNFESIDFDKFVAQHMGNEKEQFVYENNSIQIYPLSIANTFIKPPVPLFRAEYNFLLLFTRGGGVQQIDDKTIDLQANDILFIREGHLNGIKSIAPDTQGYYIYLDNVVMSQVFSDRSLLNRFTFNPKHAVDSEDMDWLCKCCELLTAQSNSKKYFQDAQSSLVKAIFSRLASSWPATHSIPDRPSEITLLFKELLYENFMSKREVNFYADMLAVSENYLNRCVKQVTGKTPKQHINERVIDHSKVLLQDSSQDISQIAFDLNFSDPAYFGRIFKQLTRQTPSEYRNAHWQVLS